MKTITSKVQRNTFLPAFALMIPMLSCAGSIIQTRDASAVNDASHVRDAGAGCTPAASDRVYSGDSLSADWAIIILDGVAGYNASLDVSDAVSGRSTFVSIPQWGSQTITIGTRSVKIVVKEMSDASPSWADLDAYSCP